MRKNLYAGGCRAMMGGVSIPLAFKLSAHALTIMREGYPREIFNDDAREAKVIAYAQWLARRDGIQTTEGAGVRGVVVYDYVDMPEGGHKRRPRYVTFERGAMRTEMIYSPRGKFKGYGSERWERDELLATVEIPNWDHVPTVRDMSAPALLLMAAE